MAVRQLFMIYDKCKCYPEHRKDEASRAANADYPNFFATLLARFKSSDMQRLKVEASECNRNVSASCPKQAPPPVFFVWHV